MANTRKVKQDTTEEMSQSTGMCRHQELRDGQPEKAILRSVAENGKEAFQEAGSSREQKKGLRQETQGPFMNNKQTH